MRHGNIPHSERPNDSFRATLCQRPEFTAEIRDLNRRFLILGSGKMARNIGLFFIRKGNSVNWVSRDANSLANINRWYRKTIQRLAKLDQDFVIPAQARFYLSTYPKIPPADVIIESTSEELIKKQALLKALESMFSEETLVVSNSSSILPRDIHPYCAGLHFFYPLELSCLAEVIIPDSYPDQMVSKLLALLSESNLRYIRETEDTAFVVSRLLLPVQTECFRALMAGHEPHHVNRSTISGLLPVGQLTLMDSIGLDILCPSVENFLDRIKTSEAKQYAPLREGLIEVLSMGKKGTKNKNGLLVGAQLPWSLKPISTSDLNRLPKKFLYLFINTCYYALERNEIDESGLDMALEGLFSPDVPLSQMVETKGRETICKELYD